MLKKNVAANIFYEKYIAIFGNINVFIIYTLIILLLNTTDI